MTSKKTASVLASVVAVSAIAGNVSAVNAQHQGEALLNMHKEAEITTGSAVAVQPVEEIKEEVKLVNDLPSLMVEGDTKVWNFGSLDFQVLVQNAAATIQEIEIDATASGAKFNAVARDNAQVNAGTVIKVPVNGSSLIEVMHGYDKGALTVKDPSGKLIGTIDGVSDNWSTDTISYTGSKSGFLTLEVPSGQVYIKTIKTVEVKQEEVGTFITVGPNGDYEKVQEAVDAIIKKPTADKRVTIEIEPGIYEEEVTISKPYITLKNADPTREVKITYDKAVDHDSDPAKVQGTQKTASVTISSGATGFEAYDITFENSYNLGQENLGHEGRKQTQAVALVSMADRVVFERCNFIGRQDTLYLKGASKGKDNPEVNERRVYLKDCYIEGTIDFVFGDATAVFENCELYMAYYSNGGYYTAPNTHLQSVGFVFNECAFTVDAAYDQYMDASTGESSKKVNLGRPWQADGNYPYVGSQSVLVNCQLSPLIARDGWSPWSNLTVKEKVRFMEYGSYYTNGTSVDSVQRADWARGLNEKQAAAFNTENVLRGTDDWNPSGRGLGGITEAVDITLDTYEILVEQGKSEQIIATVLPTTALNNGYIWHSADSDIAVVNSLGVVTGVNPGTTEVIAVSVDNDCEVKATVTVSPAKTAPPVVAEIAIKNQGTISVGDSLEGTYVYEDEIDQLLDTAKVQWYAVNPATGEEILRQEGKEAVDKSYRVSKADMGMQIKFVVIPETKTTYGQVGLPVASQLSEVVSASACEMPELYVREAFGSFMENYTNVTALNQEVNTKWYGSLVSKKVEDNRGLNLLTEGQEGNKVSAWKAVDTNGTGADEEEYNAQAALSANINYQENAAVLIYNANEAWTNYAANARGRFSPKADGFSSASYWDMYINYDAATNSGYRLSMTRGGNTKSVVLALYKVVEGKETLIAEDKKSFENKLAQGMGEENPYFNVVMQNKQGEITAQVSVEGLENVVTLSFEDEKPLAGTIAFESFGKTGCPILDMVTVEEILVEKPSVPSTPLEPSIPTVPSTPLEPSIPTVPSTPLEPSIPTVPSTPLEPSIPTVPSTPLEPSIPTVPSTPLEPSKPIVPDDDSDDSDDTVAPGTGGSGSSGSTSDKKDEAPSIQVGTANDEAAAEQEGATSSQIVFKDLKQHSWAAEAIHNLAAKGVIKGEGEGKFSPASKVKRADSVVMLVRLLGAVKGELVDVAKHSGEVHFADAPADAYYADYLAYAKANGLIKGIGENTFAPTQTISRQDMMVMMVSALEQMNMLDTNEADLSVLDDYADMSNVSVYAKPAVALMIQKGIITGTNKGIEPKAAMTRAQSAVMMNRFMALFEK